MEPLLLVQSAPLPFGAVQQREGLIPLRRAGEADHRHREARIESESPREVETGILEVETPLVLEPLPPGLVGGPGRRRDLAPAREVQAGPGRRHEQQRHADQHDRPTRPHPLLDTAGSIPRFHSTRRHRNVMSSYCSAPPTCRRMSARTPWVSSFSGSSRRCEIEAISFSSPKGFISPSMASVIPSV